MKSLVFFICLLFISCTAHKLHYEYTRVPHSSYAVPSRVIPVWIDKEFSVEDKLAIDDSLNQWNYSLNGNLLLKVVDYNFNMEPLTINEIKKEKGWMILKVETGNKTIPDEEGSKDRTLAWTNRIGGDEIRVVRDRITSDMLVPIMLHEEAHAFGIEHSPDARNLLYYQYSSSYICVDYDAASRVFKVLNLDLNTMNYCVYKY